MSLQHHLDQLEANASTLTRIAPEAAAAIIAPIHGALEAAASGNQPQHDYPTIQALVKKLHDAIPQDIGAPPPAAPPKAYRLG